LAGEQVHVHQARVVREQSGGEREGRQDEMRRRTTAPEGQEAPAESRPIEEQHPEPEHGQRQRDHREDEHGEVGAGAVPAGRDHGEGEPADEGEQQARGGEGGRRPDALGDGIADGPARNV
jgi:hypothetical protein